MCVCGEGGLQTTANEGQAATAKGKGMLEMEVAKEGDNWIECKEEDGLRRDKKNVA